MSPVGRRAGAAPIRTALVSLVVAGGVSCKAAHPFADYQPAGWEKVRPGGDDRIAQWRVPRVPAGRGDAEVAVFFFGRGNLKAVDDVLARWESEIEVGPYDVQPHTATKRYGDADLTIRDLQGTYRASPDDEPLVNWRMVAAKVEIDTGPYVVRLHGPKETAGPAEHGVTAMLRAVFAR